MAKKKPDGWMPQWARDEYDAAEDEYMREVENGGDPRVALDAGDATVTADRDLTVALVAKRERKCETTIRRWLKAGQLPGAYKDGRDWRIPVEALDARRDKLREEREERAQAAAAPKKRRRRRATNGKATGKAFLS